eukprot:7216026-Prymnesium_polylepis.2
MDTDATVYVPSVRCTALDQRASTLTVTQAFLSSPAVSARASAPAQSWVTVHRRSRVGPASRPCDHESTVHDPVNELTHYLGRV